MAAHPQSGKHVVIVGAGFGGINIAKLLDPYLRVTLVERKERYFFNVASLRATVDPGWLGRIFIPYDRLLRHGRVLHDTVVEASPQAVRLASGETLTFDYLVLATGSSYPFPARTQHDDVPRAVQQMRLAGERIRQARGVLLVGAGPVGIEFAGEIKSAYPDKPVTLIDSAPALLSQFKPRLAEQLMAAMKKAGVRVILGEQLQPMPAQTNALAPDGPLVMQTFVTDKGTRIEAELHFTCFGTQVNSAYLAPGLAGCRDARGRIKVNSFFQVEGHGNIFAIGDVTNLNEAKLGSVAELHAKVVGENIRRLVGTNGTGTLMAYKPLAVNFLVVPFGSRGGAGQIPYFGGIVIGRFLTSLFKGKSLLVGQAWRMLRQPGNGRESAIVSNNKGE
jgi:NADH dehydrogenase FAD-containing subunit